MFPQVIFLKKILSSKSYLKYLYVGIIIEVNDLEKFGWKVPFTNVEAQCKSRTGEELFKCIEENAYPHTAYTNSTFTTYKNSSFYIHHSLVYPTIKPYLSKYKLGLVYSVRLKPGMMSRSALTTVTIVFDPNQPYRIRLTDPNLEFLCRNPDAIPRTMVKQLENNIVLYVQVSQSVKTSYLF